MEIKVGRKGSKEEIVTKDKVASAVGSGSVAVYATPCLVLLAEATCKDCVAPFLEEGMTTVGTSVCIEHIAATPMDMRVCCECKLTEVDGRRLVFEVSCFDEAEQVGRGTHERVIINQEKFEAKVNAKKQ